MASPTNVRVEAVAQSIAVVRWTYAGSAGLGLYRSTDGISYSLITSPLILSSVASYDDTTVASDTKYWYKLSDDAGATYSAIVTVWSHQCAPALKNTGIALPRFGDEADPSGLNDLAVTVEGALNLDLSQRQKVSTVCINDGRLVINCESEQIEIEVDQDINSISILNCDDASSDLTFIIPPSTTRAIGGWPRGIGFTGDEGWTNPVAGGTSGRTIMERITSAVNQNAQSGKSKPGVTTQGTDGGGTASSSGGQQCVGGTNGELTLKVSKPNGQANTGNSLNCASSDKGARVEACGGRGPYTFSSTGSVVLSNTTGLVTTVTLPANAGSGVAGTAYVKYGGIVIGVNLSVYSSPYGCNDQQLSACGSVTIQAQTNNCRTAPDNLGLGSCGLITSCADAGDCTYGSCDARTAAMISAGCNPCGAQTGATVSVTDALGTVTTIVMTA